MVEYTRMKRDAEMKAEYVTTHLTIKKLAFKYRMSVETASAICNRDGWKEAKRDYIKKLQAQSVKNATRGISERVLSINNRHFQTWEKLLTLINDILDDEKQYSYATGEIKLGKLEMIAKIMLMVQQGQRTAKGIGDTIELKKLDIAMERLKLEVKKITGVTEPEQEDDGFIVALKGRAETVWGDELDVQEA